MLCIACTLPITNNSIRTMSILTSALKGKGVQSAFCSLCSSAASVNTTAAAAVARSRAFSSTIPHSQQLSDAEYAARRARGNVLMQEDVAKRAAARQERLSELSAQSREWAKEGPRPGSVIAERQGKGRTNELRSYMTRTSWAQEADCCSCLCHCRIT